MTRKPKRPVRKRSDKHAAPVPFVADRAIHIYQDPNDADRNIIAQKLAQQMLDPATAAVRAINAAEGNSAFGAGLDAAGVRDELQRLGDKVNAGDMRRPERMLFTQAVTLEALFTRLTERAVAQSYLPQFETYMRLGLKAQAQSRLAIEALAALKSGPTVIAKQANLSGGGPMQVNNGASARATVSEKTPNGLLRHEPGLDAGEATRTSASDKAVAAVGKVDRT